MPDRRATLTLLPDQLREVRTEQRKGPDPRQARPAPRLHPARLTDRSSDRPHRARHTPHASRVVFGLWVWLPERTSLPAVRVDHEGVTPPVHAGPDGLATAPDVVSTRGSGTITQQQRPTGATAAVTLSAGQTYKAADGWSVITQDTAGASHVLRASTDGTTDGVPLTGLPSRRRTRRHCRHQRLGPPCRRRLPSRHLADDRRERTLLEDSYGPIAPTWDGSALGTAARPAPTDTSAGSPPPRTAGLGVLSVAPDRPMTMVWPEGNDPGHVADVLTARHADRVVAATTVRRAPFSSASAPARTPHTRPIRWSATAWGPGPHGQTCPVVRRWRGEVSVGPPGRADGTRRSGAGLHPR